MNVLVTGSSGFIGRSLVPALLAAGHRVGGFDHTPDPAPAPGLDFVRGDLLDPAALKARFAAFAPDAVVHLAARADLDERAGLAGYAANVEGVENLCVAVAATPTVKRLVVTSTQLVCRVGYRPQHDTDYAATTTYGKSKVRTEEITRERDGGGVPWCLVRPTTVWGPGMSAHYRRFFRMIRRGRYFHVGKTPRYRHMGYVGNVCHQYIRLLEADSERIHRRVFYVADYDPISVQEWSNLLQRSLGGPPIRTLPASVGKLLAKSGDVVNALGWRSFPFNSFRLTNVLSEYTYDLSPTRDVCGPLPFTPAEGAERTAQWFLAAEPTA